MKKENTTVFSDPIYGYIRVEKGFIKELIDTPFFQRLRRIKQLSGVTMVFHTAEHSRFSHSLGAYELARRFLDIEDLKDALSEREKNLFLTAALLHDIGHGPYSHAFEKTFNTNHELIGSRIITTNPDITAILNNIDNQFADDVSSIILRKGNFPLLEQLISSQLDVDRLDYLIRDSYQTGVPYGLVDIDKIIRSIKIINNQVVFSEGSVHTLENFFFNRYHMYWQVYYHPTGRSYEFILENIYKRLRDLINSGYQFKEDLTYIKRVMESPYDLEAYLKIDDYYINGLFNSFINNDDDILRKLSLDFLNRKIWKNIDANEKSFIEENKKQYTIEEDKYFHGITAVRQSVYQTSLYDKDRELLVLKGKEIVELSEVSSIIKNLLNQDQKKDNKYFYRLKNDE